MLFVLIGFLILCLCFVNPFRFSLFFIFYFLFFISPIDSYAIFELLKKGNDGVYAGSVLLLFLSYCIFGFYFFKYRKIFNSTIRNFIFIVNLLLAIIFFNTLIKEFDLLYSISVTVSTGLPFCLMACFAFYNSNKNAMYGFVLLIFLKICLSLLVIFNSDSLFFLNGAFYQKELGGFVLDAEVNSFSGMVTLDKSLVGSYGIFHNPNSLGLHSILLMSVGVILFLNNQVKIKALGFLLLSLSILAWLNSLTRGPLVFLFAAIALIFIVKNKASYIKINFALISLVLSMMVFWFIFSDSLLNYLIPSSDNVSVTGRVEGYGEGLQAFIENPILGIERNDFKWENMHIPHLFFLYYAYQFGFFPALVVFFLIFNYFFKVCRRVFSLKSIDNFQLLSVMWLFVLLGISLTNNFTAPFTFWSLFSFVLLNIYQLKGKSSA